MKQILETERLFLRELTTNDSTNFYELNLNPKVVEFTGDKPFASEIEAREFLENYTDYSRNGYGRWAAITKADHKFAGWCGLKYDASVNETDIGFRFFEHHWNKGFATESATACLHYGITQLGLNPIVGRAMAANTGSLRVLEKIGMVYQREFDFNGQKGAIFSKGQL